MALQVRTIYNARNQDFFHHDLSNNIFTPQLIYLQTTMSKTASLIFQWNFQGSQNTHETKVREYPREGYGKAEEGTKLCKELKLTEEEWYTGYDTRDHSIKYTNSEISKCFCDTFVRISFGNLVGMCEMNNVID